MMITIDGSFGEGGGQILRTALSLSLATGTPFRIENIRAKRKQPGLLRQHLTAVLAASEIGGAEIQGAVLGSAELTFTPKTVRTGEFRFAVRTAGSGTLVFQTILPALMRAAAPARIVIEGGTHNFAAPPFDFLERAFLPLICRMGPKVSVKLERYGFYPAGGGRFAAEIEPRPSLTPIHLGVRGPIRSERVRAIVANLSRRIAEREVKKVEAMLSCPRECLSIEETRNSPGPGNIVFIEIASDDVTEVFSSFGRLGVASERVADEAVRQAREYLVSRAAVAEHLTDQLLLPMALAGEGSFTATKLSMHARTNIEVISKFLPVRFEVQPAEGYSTVTVFQTPDPKPVLELQLP
jgi:RNA 3'-terminal phosphate cyclase (ATP)